LYPLEIDLLIGNVTGVPAGVYRYRPAAHVLQLRQHGDLRDQLRQAAFQQHEIVDAAVILVIAAVVTRTARKYGDRAERYVHMEVGHAAQCVCLQAAALGLGTVVIGAFDDDAVKKVLGIASQEVPLALMPIGYPD
jgi:SagB-type dehydrogenase family enzyme